MTRGRLFLIILPLLILIISASAQSTQSDEFQSSFNKPFRKPATNFAKHPSQRIDGLLPMPWNDDSAWCDLEVEYLQLQENPGEGEQSLRVVVKRLPRGSRAQFGLRDFPLKADKEVSIRFLAKSPDYTPVSLMVVQKKSPYKSYFTQRIQPSAEWAEFEVLVPGGMQDADTQLLFTIEQPGTFDLDNFRYQRRKFEAADVSADKLGNLLPSSVFPLGAAPPWVAHGFAKAETGELTGPTGAPALVLDVRRQPGFSRFEQSLRVGYKATAGQMATVRVSANLLEGEAEIALRTGVERIWMSPWGTAAKMDRGWRTYEHKVMLPV